MPDVPFRNGPKRYPAVTNASTKFSPMAERPREHVEVEEFKSFTPPNVPTTSASTTRLALGSLDFNTRVPDTGTATPSRRRLTESQRLELGNSSKKMLMQWRRPRRCRLCRKNRHDWQVNIRAGVLHPTFTSNELLCSRVTSNSYLERTTVLIKNYTLQFSVFVRKVYLERCAVSVLVIM